MNAPSPKLIYLHGFASSPQSFKAERFKYEYLKRGLSLEIPDLNEGDFKNLTVSRQVRLLERLTEDTPSAILIGSSMGGYAAALFAAQSETVRALVLMCPAFAFYRRWSEKLGSEAIEDWQRQGEMPTRHFATGQMERIAWSLMADAKALAEVPHITQPTLLLHGRHDETVPFEGSADFAQNRSNVTLKAFESDHGLGNVVDALIATSLAFLAPWVKTV